MKKPLFAFTSIVLLLAGCSLDIDSSKVKVSERPAQGLTESSFDQGYLQQLMEETRQAAEESLTQAYQRNNVPAAERISHAETSGRYERIGDHELAVIDLSYTANPMRVVRILGIQNDRLITISCISPQGAPLDLYAADGECAETLRKSFSIAGAK